MREAEPRRSGPVAPGRVSLRVAAAGDRFLIRRWLDLPKVSAWFGSRASAHAVVMGALDSDTALARVILVGGTAAGYVQATDAGAQRAAEVPVGALRADIFIGEERFRGRGVGTVALRLLTREVFETTLVPAIVIEVPVAREAQVRAIEAAGFRWRAIVEDPALGRMWLLSAERP